MSHANVSDSAFLLYIHEKSGGPGYLEFPDVPDTYFCPCLFIKVTLQELSKGINLNSFYPSIFHQKQSGRQHAAREKKKEPGNWSEQASASVLLVPLTSLRLGKSHSLWRPQFFPGEGTKWPQPLKVAEAPCKLCRGANVAYARQPVPTWGIRTVPDPEKVLSKCLPTFLPCPEEQALH